MRAFWRDPYLWVHLAGLAALPLFLELCVLGLAVGDPILPVWLEVLLVAGLGIAPVLWMQWQRPFYIFSIVAIALKPQELTEDQRRLLTLFKAQRNRFVAVGLAIGLLLVLQRLYNGAAIASDLASVLPGGRLTGLLLAAVGFFGSNLFLQVPASVAGVMLAQAATFEATPPFPAEQIQQNFTLLGLQVRRILPPLVLEPISTLEPVATVPQVEVRMKPTDSVDSTVEEAGVEAIVPQLEVELENLKEEVAQPDPE
ncbi:MAG TPA: low-complexity tail membrane protein [Thermosynechococcaceae cyanobacterium]